MKLSFKWSFFFTVLVLTISLLTYSDLHAKSYKEYMSAGNLYYKNKEYNKAIKEYQEAVKLSSDNVNAYYNLGLTYKYMKDYPSSIKNFEIYLKNSDNKKKIKAVKNIVYDMSEALSRPTTTGKLTHYEIWEGWILIDSDVIVPEDIVLTIKPGALVMFTPLKSKYDVRIPYLKKEETDYFASLIVRGTLIAEGESENEILFSNSFEDIAAKKIGLWGGLVFDGSKNSILKYAKIERAKNGVVIKSKPQIEFSNNVFVKNEVSIKLIDDSPINLDNNIFYRNDVGIECLSKSIPNATNNNFTKNNYGIIATDKSRPKISKNTFDQNNCGVCSYEKAFPNIFNNLFKGGKFGISMTESSKSFIKSNKFVKNSIGVNSLNNSSPSISQNEFTNNLTSGVNAADNSTAVVEINKFHKNKVGIAKVETVKTIQNEFLENIKDVNEIN